VNKILLLLVLLLASCRDHRPARPSPEQSQELNDAEDMLNSMERNEEGPADRSAGPSNKRN
jgi:hypothetical protein